MGVIVRKLTSQDGQVAAVEDMPLAHTPIRIGRNMANDIVLSDARVSEWHAVISQHRGSLAYVDLDSTNGTEVDGVRVPPQTPIPLDLHSSVLVGSVTLTFVSPNAESVRDETAKTSLFSPSEATGKIAPDVQLALRMGARLGNPVAAFVAARKHLRTALDREWALVPPESEEHVRRTLLSLHPDLAEIVTTDAQVTNETTTAQATLISQPGSFGPPGAASDSAERALLQLFAQALLELRRCQQQLCSELSLPLRAHPLLDENDSASALLQHLLEHPEEVSIAVRRDLALAFSSIAAHQVGLVSAITQGARALLSRVSPARICSLVDGSDARAGDIRLLDMLVPFRPIALWRCFSDTHHDLDSDDRFVSTLFGPEFCEAYNAVTRGVSEGNDGPE